MAKHEKIDFGTWALLNSSNEPICDYEGILEVVKSVSSQVLTEPIEGGELAAYNKVQQPDAVRVTLSLGGDPATQSACLEQIKALKQGTGSEYLCKLVTVSDVTDSLALESFSQSHTAQQNATLLVVELLFVRIRSVSVSTQTVKWSPKKATSADQVNNGRTQSYAYAQLSGN